MKNFIYKIFIAYLLFAAGGCTSPAEKYLDSALDTIEKHAICSKNVDWKKLRNKLHKEAETVKTIKGTYPFINDALWYLHDNHSFFYTVDERRNPSQDTTGIAKEIFQKRIINNTIGYLKIPAFKYISDSLCLVFAAFLQEEIKDLDTNLLKGWIIDLTDNAGGDMWPMLCGIGPFIGNGTAGYFVYPDSLYSPWVYRDGEAICTNENTLVKIDSPYTLKNKGKKLAVLINNRTASSGEAIAVALKGLPNTVFFGQSTYGVATCNKGFYLSDSSMLVLAVANFADRNKTVYDKKINPDTVVNDPRDILPRAISWIEKQ